MGTEQRTTWVFPEVVDKFLTQMTTTLHDLDALQPGTTMGAIGEYFDSMHEESKLRIELLQLQLKVARAQESSNPAPNELKEVRQLVSGMSGTLKGLDKRLKTLEPQRIERPDAPVPAKKWGQMPSHSNKSSRFERGNKSPAIPPLPPLQQQLQPQNATEVNGDALHIDRPVKREEPTQEKMPFNSSLGDQISTKVKTAGT